MMSILIFISAIGAPAASQEPADEAIIVTASRVPVAAVGSAASMTVFDEEELDHLSLPAAPDLLRLAPGLTVATTGPRGTQTQVRIRGAEANHTLIFVDGIRFNDPAAGNEARFELLTSDSLSRLEIIRGPQSALWGSEAIGGVIAAETPDPFRAGGFEGLAEYGSLDSARLASRYAFRSGNVGFSASAGWLRSDGIDSQGPSGERDGFENRAASVKLEVRPSNAIRGGLVGHWIEGVSEYDGFDPFSFLPTEAVETENRIAAVRGWVSGEWGGWSARADISYLDSVNRNFFQGAPVDRSSGDRLTFNAQVARRWGGHQLIAAVEHQKENFQVQDPSSFINRDQDRSRRLTAIVGEWRAEWSKALVTDLAVRHDSFSAFADAANFRASLLVRPMRKLSLHGAFGEGIAQPTFYDLYGFLPGSFAGNPDLGPESSRGWEAGISWHNRRFEIGATYFSARLNNEIIEIFGPVSRTANAGGTSRRHGIELHAGYRHADWLNLAANYTWLDSDQQRVAGAPLVPELRRARHSANLVGFGERGSFRWGASLAYVGARLDDDFNLFQTVSLGDYALASVNVAYHILPQFELFVRAENLFDADYQDVVGYNTPGRTVHAGLRLALGR